MPRSSVVTTRLVWSLLGEEEGVGGRKREWRGKVRGEGEREGKEGRGREEEEEGRERGKGRGGRWGGKGGG